MAETWVCGDCRSFNKGKADRCYRCHVPRRTSEMTEATAAFTAAAQQESRTLLAQVERLGARYHATWPLAVLLIPIIAVATVTSVLQVAAVSALVTADGRLIEDPAIIDAAVRMTVLSTGSFLLGVVVWSIWIARVTTWSRTSVCVVMSGATS